MKITTTMQNLSSLTVNINTLTPLSWRFYVPYQMKPKPTTTQNTQVNFHNFTQNYQMHPTKIEKYLIFSYQKTDAN